MDRKLPFTISSNETFIEKLGEWVGDVFYDILPEAGFELRDEQVFMAFQLERAFKNKEVIFAEAGVGTGKTIVYLLYAICYARYTGRPAIIACSDETLIEQLVKKEGDIPRLEQALDLNVDVRLAKSRTGYLCLQKLNQSLYIDEAYRKVYEDLPSFVFDDGSMQQFSHYGDRKDYPYLSDEQWNQIGWDPLYDCLACSYRHRCGQSLHREHYRKSTDLIVCSHDFFMEHIWTKESRRRNGQLPLLPESSCVVFDEGHLLEYACQKALTYQLSENTLEQLLTRLMENDVREETLILIEDILMENQVFFEELTVSSNGNDSTEKQSVSKTKEVINSARKLLDYIIKLQEELVFDGELYQINEYDLRIVEEYLDQMEYSLSLFLQELKGIIWFEEHEEERKLVIMPRMVTEVMKEEVFSEKKPYIFSSATLSENKSFSYMATSLGIEDYQSFTVESPFDYESNVALSLPNFSTKSQVEKQIYTLNAIQQSDGRALVLFTSDEDMKSFRTFIDGKTTLPVYTEGEQEISTLVSRFQNEEQSVLLSTHLWEGLDIPGRALENVVIFDLPFPPNDPVFAAKREGASDPFDEIDLPYMLLRLRQGIGRLIRTREDKGTLHILLNNSLNEKTKEKVLQVLPIKGEIYPVQVK